jgi:exo-beta-1,3-glucanase (GH17 family)
MKKSSCHWLKVFASMVFLCSLILSGCAGQAKTDQQKPDALQQKPSDLLAGVANAVCYSGFRHGQHPDMGNGAKNPTDGEILEDLKILTRDSNFGLIRLYSSDENSEAVLRLIKANNINIKVMLGIWLNAEVSNHKGCAWLTKPIPQEVLAVNKAANKKEVERAIRLAKKYPDIVVAVNVGNEILVKWTDHMVSLDSLISYVREVKKSISQPVTVADNHAVWVENGPVLAKELDFVTVHTYPLWEDKSIDIDKGLSYSIETIKAVRRVIPKSRIVIGEAGWTSMGIEFGPRASEEKQKQHYEELTAWAAKMNITTFFFEAFDEDWKGNTSDDAKNAQIAEKHWGLFTIDRKAKLAMYEKYPDLVPAK